MADQTLDLDAISGRLAYGYPDERYAIGDDMRALLAEVEWLAAENTNHMAWLAEARDQRDQIAMDRDELDIALGEAHAEIGRLRAELDRLRANQLPDGGEWQYGYVNPDTAAFVVFTDQVTAAALADPHDRPHVRRRRVWYGPAQPIENP